MYSFPIHSLLFFWWHPKPCAFPRTRVCRPRRGARLRCEGVKVQVLPGGMRRMGTTPPMWGTLLPRREFWGCFPANVPPVTPTSCNGPAFNQHNKPSSVSDGYIWALAVLWDSIECASISLETPYQKEVEFVRIVIYICKKSGQIVLLGLRISTFQWFS